MTRNFATPHVEGHAARQAHADIPAGSFEREIGRDGFAGPAAHMYHRNPPTAWLSVEGPIRPRAFNPGGVAGAAASPFAAMNLLGNASLGIRFWRAERSMDHLARNADGDDLLFVHRGRGALFCDYGRLSFVEGDYLLLPRGTSYRLSPTSPSRLLVIEAFSEVSFPEKGMLGQHALFDPAVLQVPTPEASSLQANAAGEWELRIMQQGEMTKVFYPFNPHDVVGWKGTLAALKLNVRDIRPVLSDRYHLPPSAHSTFIMHNAVVCSFLPRPLENGDPVALKVPFYHSNIDFDEVLFYHSGDFFSRAGIAPGMLTFHPQGIHHGPQQKAFERSRAATRTEEVAVMLDTKRPLKVLSPAAPTEITEYWKSWKE